MSYFYILPGPYRVGFGITGDHERREKDYTGAWGGVAQFAYLFEGASTHVKRLENIIKIQNQDMLWKVDEWKTEWLDNGWSAEQLLDFVKDIVQERHLKVTQIR
jgi:hypothetical protein